MTTFRHFVQAEIARRCAKNPRYSLRALARALAIDPATLSQLVRGRRRMTARTIRRIGTALGLASEEIAKYVRFEDKPATKQPPGALRTLDELEKDLAALVEEWQHHAILELTTLEDFRPDTRWIARVLDTPPDTVNVALQRLTRLGLLKMVSSSKWATEVAPAPAVKRITRSKAGRPVVKWQMIARDPERLAAFYAELFGWKIDAENALHYREVNTGSPRGIGGGIWPAPPEAPSFVQLFVEVSDLEAAVAQARALGAEVIVPPQELPDGDALAIVKDPAGIPLGMTRASLR
jgi:predicted enzyme related to lactoylglutathione lyase/transcriptional regulator with XRE-family HTH domain